jgi:DnaJ-class molecular chaperone
MTMHREGLGRITFPPIVPMPHTLKMVCPVCQGTTVKRRGFYPDEGAVGSEWVKCRSCHGRGVV